jgi:hypothetical protein
MKKCKCLSVVEMGRMEWDSYVFSSVMLAIGAFRIIP